MTNEATPKQTTTPMAERTSPTSIRIERVLAKPVERVWRYLVESDLRARWLCAGRVGTRAGDSIEFAFDHRRLGDSPPPERFAEVAQVDLVGTILEIEPPERIAFAWPSEEGAEDTLVTIVLTAVEGGTRLVLTHESMPSDDDLFSASAGWHVHLDILVCLCGDTATPDFWPAHEIAEATYRSAWS